MPNCRRATVHRQGSRSAITVTGTLLTHRLHCIKKALVRRTAHHIGRDGAPRGLGWHGARVPGTTTKRHGQSTCSSASAASRRSATVGAACHGSRHARRHSTREIERSRGRDGAPRGLGWHGARVPGTTTKRHGQSTCSLPGQSRHPGPQGFSFRRHLAHFCSPRPRPRLRPRAATVPASTAPGSAPGATVEPEGPGCALSRRDACTTCSAATARCGPSSPGTHGGYRMALMTMCEGFMGTCGRRRSCGSQRRSPCMRAIFAPSG